MGVLYGAYRGIRGGFGVWGLGLGLGIASLVDLCFAGHQRYLGWGSSVGLFLQFRVSHLGLGLGIEDLGFGV